MRRMDVSEVRGSLATVVDRVRKQRNVVVIVRYGRPLAALVPIARLSAGERQTLVVEDGVAGNGTSVAPARSSTNGRRRVRS